MRMTLVPGCLSKLVDIWWIYGGQVQTAGHLVDTYFNLDLTQPEIAFIYYFSTFIIKIRLKVTTFFGL